MSSEYYEGQVACSYCGDIRQGNNREVCGRCKRTGHLYRMQSLVDLQARIERDEASGYHKAAIREALIRDALALAIEKVAA